MAILVHHAVLEFSFIQSGRCLVNLLSSLPYHCEQFKCSNLVLVLKCTQNDML